MKNLFYINRFGSKMGIAGGGRYLGQSKAPMSGM